MATREYVDISHHNTVSDWSALKAWSLSFDGTSQLCAKLTEGTGFVDPDNFSKQALDNGFNVVMPYHYGRPDLGNTPQQEAAYFVAHLPAGLRQTDYLMLDYEGIAGKPNSLFPASWALAWLQTVAATNRVAAGHVVLYSYNNFVQTNLQLPALAAYPLIFARYTSVQPSAPPPWKSYLGWQYTASGSVPGVSSPVDINRWYGPTAGPDIPLVISLLQQAIAELEK